MGKGFSHLVSVLMFGSVLEELSLASGGTIKKGDRVRINDALADRHPHLKDRVLEFNSVRFYPPMLIAQASPIAGARENLVIGVLSFKEGVTIPISAADLERFIPA
jgi:hypothetical protein